jgi:hypothetical protein
MQRYTVFIRPEAVKGDIAVLSKPVVAFEMMIRAHHPSLLNISLISNVLAHSDGL